METLPERTPQTLLESTRRQLHHAIATAQSSGRAPSVLGAIVRNGELAWWGGHGFVGDELATAPDANTQYRIGSITKTFVAVLIMRLRDEGRLDLLDTLDTHLPDAGLDGRIGALRIGELLAHTGGIASETPPPWWERAHGSARPALADLLAPDAAKLPAGRHFHYSNTGFALLGAVVEQLRGVQWLDAATQEILTPLGMDRTTPMPTPPAAQGYAVHPWADLVLPEPAPDATLMAPAGQLWSTIEDLAKYSTFLLDGHPDVLSAHTLAQMRLPASPPASSATGPEWEGGFGLGLQLARLHGRNLAGHSGSMPGFLATVWTAPEAGLAAITLANATHGVRPVALAAQLIDTVAQAEPALPPPWRPATAVDADALEISGVWYWGANPFALRVRSDGVSLDPLTGAGRASRFYPDPVRQGRWLGCDGYYQGESLLVVRGPAGSPSHLEIGGFTFTRQPYEAGRSDDPVPGGVDPDGWRGRSV